MEVGHLGGVGDDRIDDDHRPLRILGNLVEHHPRPREALRHPGVLTNVDRDLGVLELTAGMPAVQVLVDPGLARLLLCQRVGAVLGSDGLQEGTAIGPAQVIALTAPAVIKDLVSAITVTDVLEALGDLDDGRIPIDFLIGTVGSAAHR